VIRITFAATGSRCALGYLMIEKIFKKRWSRAKDDFSPEKPLSYSTELLSVPSPNEQAWDLLDSNA
jgi:hypothetical protein